MVEIVDDLADTQVPTTEAVQTGVKETVVGTKELIGDVFDAQNQQLRKFNLQQKDNKLNLKNKN